ncbi:MAG: hypothetical protein RLZZ601_223 [Pseudomonadota bacterium]|jgi:hypothetical protein
MLMVSWFLSFKGLECKVKIQKLEQLIYFVAWGD